MDPLRQIVDGGGVCAFVDGGGGIIIFILFFGHGPPLCLGPPHNCPLCPRSPTALCRVTLHAHCTSQRTDPQCIARPSPFKVNGDQSTDGGSGHKAYQRRECTACVAKGRCLYFPGPV
ncbi:unnamed protein product [Gadus morhua 'NCC']